MQKSEGSVTAADGTRLHFEVIGDAAPVVLVPNGTYLVDDLVPLAERRRLVVTTRETAGGPTPPRAAEFCRTWRTCGPSRCS